ncbi:MAG: hypothetical protein LBB94_02100 [Clostridiales bacterium]|nr:hypothetical protein [Clostridiales bacterium]
MIYPGSMAGRDVNTPIASIRLERKHPGLTMNC